MICGHTLMIKDRLTEADKALKEAFNLFRLLNGAISEGRPIYDGYIIKVESFLQQNLQK